jgi:hypothetical protein
MINTNDISQKNLKLRNTRVLAEKLLKKLIQYGAIAFGGIVRDICLIEFLESKQEYGTITIVPSDIDVVVSKKIFNYIMENVLNNYYIKNIKTDSQKTVNYNCQRNITIKTYEVVELLSEPIFMKIDFLIININIHKIENYPPYSKKSLDCDVNCLLMDNIHGIYVSPKLTNNIFDYEILSNNENLQLIKILENIKNKEIEVFRNMDSFRLQKMIVKGWKIKKIHTEIFIYDLNDKFNDCCTICLNKFQEITKELKIKIKIEDCHCNIRYCIKCSNEMVYRNFCKCPVCSKPVIFNNENALNELELLRIYSEKNKKSFHI